MIKRYMHTISALPATFDGQQIVYLYRGCKNPFANSLKQIRQEQAACRQWRKKRGLELLGDYGYILFYDEPIDLQLQYCPASTIRNPRNPRANWMRDDNKDLRTEVARLKRERDAWKKTAEFYAITFGKSTDKRAIETLNHQYWHEVKKISEDSTKDGEG